MKKRTLFSILIIVLVVLTVAVAGCSRERPAPTPVGPTPILKTGTASPTPPGAAVTRIILSGQTPQAGSTPVPPTPASSQVSTPVPLATSTPASGGAPSGPALTASGEETNYAVQRGDTLVKIAAKFGVTVQQITELNGLANPDTIFTGQKLRIPGAASASTPSGAGKTYTVQAGDTLASIATKFSVTIQALQQANNISNPNQIFTGQVLKIP